MKNCKTIIYALSLLAVVSCGPKAVVDLTVEGVPSGEIIVKQLNINVFDVLDTVKTNASGCLKYEVKIAPGQPEFIYLFRGEQNIAALLLEAGEKVSVKVDTLGNYSVTGSEGSLKLKEVNAAYSKFIAGMSSLVQAAEDPSIPESAREGLYREMSVLYVSHYRECVKYIMENPYSLTVVPVLFQQISDYTSVFSHPTDGVRMRAAYDSLMTVYPESRYVQALGKEADRRISIQTFNMKIESAQPTFFFDIKMPDIKGEEKVLSEVDARVVMIHFWSSADADQKIFNLDELKPLYEEFHDKGFEIFSVCVDSDKARWASAVKNQKLEWINVNDGLGTASSILGVYNVTELPTSYLLLDGHLADENIAGTDNLKKILRRELK